MSRGGRGGGGSRGSTNAIADALGIQRREMAGYCNAIGKEPPPTFPPLMRRPLPLGESDELKYMAELREELIGRFHESPFYLQSKSTGDDIRRYTDKYRIVAKERWNPDWNRLPAELCWRNRKSTTASTDQQTTTNAKRSKLDKNIDSAVVIGDKLDRVVDDEADTSINESNADGDENESKQGDEEELSDDDYLEEDNDYIENYFDNGEQYGDNGSDDNLDEDAGV